ncbi:MAG: hypothetical protein IPP79_09845 [Chitinophagaceae bacterium]|nr:hypothetical protein [Chitinophagaceae bacterium]
MPGQRKLTFLGAGRFYAAGFSINDKIYFGTGQVPISGGSSLLTDWWEYNPATNIWTSKTELPFGSLIMPHAFSIGSRDIWELPNFHPTAFGNMKQLQTAGKAFLTIPEIKIFIPHLLQ